MEAYQQYSEKRNSTSSQLSQFRFTLALREKKTLTQSADKIRARIKVLQLQEDKERAKAKIGESMKYKINANKDNKHFNQQLKEIVSKEQEEEQLLKKMRIQQNREKHRLIQEQSQGSKGDQFKVKRESIKQYKEQLKRGLQETLSQLTMENKLIYQIEKAKERDRMAKINNFRINRKQLGSINYEQKVKSEIQLVNQAKNEIAILEQKEQEIVERISNTRQIIKDQ